MPSWVHEEKKKEQDRLIEKFTNKITAIGLEVTAAKISRNNFMINL